MCSPKSSISFLCQLSSCLTPSFLFTWLLKCLLIILTHLHPFLLPFSFLLLQEPSASFHCAHVWLESTSSSRDTPGTCMDFLTTSATATAGQCFVLGGAWVSRWSPASSAPWPLLSNLSPGPTAPNQDLRMGQCAKTNTKTNLSIYIYIYINIYYIYIDRSPMDASAKVKWSPMWRLHLYGFDVALGGNTFLCNIALPCSS